jgi:succinate-acetate transporter protein
VAAQLARRVSAERIAFATHFVGRMIAFSGRGDRRDPVVMACRTGVRATVHPTSSSIRSSDGTGDGRTSSVDPVRASTPAEEASWDRLQERVSITFRPIASPVSLGLFGLAAATLTLSGLQLGWVEPAEGKDVALALIGFAFLAQVTAGLFAMVARDGTVATAMAVLGLTWLVVGLTLYSSPPGSTSDALGLLLIFSAVAMTLNALTSSLTKIVPAVVFGTASLRFLVTAIYEMSGSEAWKKTSGVVGLVLFALAIYAAWASQLEDATGTTVLPIGRRNKARIAVDGSLFEQVRDVPNKPGVRTML